MTGDLRDAKKILKNLDNMILAIQGKGGYKMRQRFRVSDVEFEEFYNQCVSRLQLIGVGIVVAEKMLQEPAPSIHSRWEEYQRRRGEVVAELASPGGKT